MKLRKLVTKVMSMALACVMLATTVPMLANEVETKQDLAFEELGNAKVDSITREDADAIGEVLGVTTMSTDIVILDAESGVGIVEENSIIKSPGRDASNYENNSVLGYITEVGIYGVKLSRNDSDELVVDKTFKSLVRAEREWDAETFEPSGYEPDANDFNGQRNFGDWENLGSEMTYYTENPDGFSWLGTKYDVYLLNYTYVTLEGEERISYVMFIMEGQVETSVLKFAEDVVEPENPTPEVPTTPETPSVDDSYEVELPADNTAISSTDFSAILTENATKDVVIESNEKVTFTFAKGTMSAVEGMENYDFGTSVVNDFTSAGTMDTDVTADNFVTRINFNYSGKLPATASIMIFVGTEYAGKTLYYHKLAESGLTYITSAEVDAEGYIVVTQDSCSDYVLTTEKLVIEAPQTGDSSSVALWMMVAICGLGCVVCGFRAKKTA